MLADLKADLQAYKAKKAAEMEREQGPRDLVLRELNLDRAQAAIIELSIGKLPSAVSASASLSSLVQCGPMQPDVIVSLPDHMLQFCEN